MLQVPFESLKRVSRDRKYVIDDVRSLIVTLSDLVDKQHSDQERAQLVKQLTERSIQLRHEVLHSTSRARSILLAILSKPKNMYQLCILEQSKIWAHAIALC